VANAPLVTSQEAAARLGKSPRTVHRLVRSGVLVPAHQAPGPNGAFLFRRSDVERLAKQAAA